MYLMNEILVFSPGRRKEALDHLESIHGLMAAAPGFRVALVAKDLGGATRHTILRLWEDEATYQAFRAGSSGNYGRNCPEGLYTNAPVIPAWNQIVGQRGTAQGDFLVKVQRSVPEDAWEAWAGWTQQLAQHRSGIPGFVGFRAFRAKDRSEALAMTDYSSREAFDAELENPAYNRLLAAAPPGLGAPNIECFQILSLVGRNTNPPRPEHV